MKSLTLLQLLAFNTKDVVEVCGIKVSVKKAKIGHLLAFERLVWASMSLDAKRHMLNATLLAQNKLNKIIRERCNEIISSGKKLPLEAEYAFRLEKRPVDIRTLISGGTVIEKKKTNKGKRCYVLKCHCGNEFTRVKQNKNTACCKEHAIKVGRGLAPESLLLGSGWIDNRGNITFISKNKEVQHDEAD